ncbi:hypothetical protein [Flavobacterium sp.]|uniref:hypothetical protein n=1 Tax=Flavobacterium sp. TaxID=239 RepID=UPI003A914261
MNGIQRFARQIIKWSFNTSVKLIERFHNMDYYNSKVNTLRQYPEGTIGYDVAKCLDDHNLSLVPKYESHDLKHVLLGYEMTPVHEIRMQAFMLGNGNYTVPCFAILLFGAILLPDEWSTFYNDFKLGRKSMSVSAYTIEDYASFNTISLRQEVMGTKKRKRYILKLNTLIRYGAITSVFGGVFGMIFCLPFLFSSNIADLVGAGFPFVGGSILTVGGLYTLSNLTKLKPQAEEVV